MTKVKKRALELMHNGYFHPNIGRRIYPKWRQAYAIAKAEEQRFAARVANRLLGPRVTMLLQTELNVPK